jgi:hypothetical protein
MRAFWGPSTLHSASWNCWEMIKRFPLVHGAMKNVFPHPPGWMRPCSLLNTELLLKWQPPTICLMCWGCPAWGTHSTLSQQGRTWCWEHRLTHWGQNSDTCGFPEQTHGISMVVGRKENNVPKKASGVEVGWRENGWEHWCTEVRQVREKKLSHSTLLTARDVYRCHTGDLEKVLTIKRPSCIRHQINAWGEKQWLAETTLSVSWGTYLLTRKAEGKWADQDSHKWGQQREGDKVGWS